MDINLFSTHYHLLSPFSYPESMILRNSAYVIIFITPYRVTVPLDFFFSPRQYDTAEMTCSAVTQKLLASSRAKYVNKNDSVSRDLQSMVYIQIMQLILKLFILSLYSLHMTADK